jgi:hypothetical protein
VPIPDSDLPHTQLGHSKPKYGAEPQAREWDYGSNGNLQPQRDIDFTDHGFPDAHPHVPHKLNLLLIILNWLLKADIREKNGEVVHYEILDSR